MWDGGGDPTWDKQRFDRALRSSHTATRRVEVWSDDRLLTESAPVLGGEVTDEWVVAGIRRHLTLPVAPNRQWSRWLDFPSLVVKPFRGVRISRSLTMECPLGVFPVLPPERARPVTQITLTGNDYAEWWADADFTDKPVPRPAGRLTDALGWLIQGAGLPPPQNLSRSTGTSGEVILDGTRADAIGLTSRAANVETFIDRSGNPVIADTRVLGDPTSTILTGSGGTAIGVAVKPDWSKVYNVVVAKTSASDVSFPAQRATIAWSGNPAHPYRMGSPSRPRYRVLTWASPLLRDADQALAAAVTMLARRSAAADSYVYQAFPDPSVDGGDTTLGATITGTRVAQILSVTHPLRLGDNSSSTVTTVNTQIGDPDE